MSIQKGDKYTHTLCVGVKPREIPIEQGKQAQGFVYTISNDNYEIYGAPIITLTVGERYRFEINTPNHPFYITTDAQGAGVGRKPPLSLVGAIEIQKETGDSLGNVGIEKGVLVWTPTSDHAQMPLYYQCNYHAVMGNEIKIIEKQ